jgi:hypothetical protein
VHTVERSTTINAVKVEYSEEEIFNDLKITTAVTIT